MKQRWKLLLIIIIPTISLVVNIATISHYGINWDEPYHYRRGQAFLQFLLTGKKTYDNLPKYPPLKGDSDNPNFRNAQKNLEEVQKNPSLSDANFRRSFYQDDSWNGEFFIDVENTYGHPPLNDILASLSNLIFYQKLGILGDLESYKFFAVIATSLATFAVAIFMFYEFGIIESIFSSLVFTTYPLLIGEQHFNVKDPVETAFYTITILTAYLGIKKNNFKWLLTSTIFFALALATKFNIVFSLIPLFIWFIFYLYKTRKTTKKSLFQKIGIALLIAPIIILGILIASYPTLWKNPVNGLTQIVKFYLEVGYPTSLPSGYYFFNFFNALPSLWIIITTPPIDLILLIVSFIALPKLIKKKDFVLIVFLWFTITIARNSLFKALSYEGTRLIMEFIPSLSMLAGIGAGYLIKLKNNKKYLVTTSVIITLAFIPTIYKLIKIHPNENVYFNLFVGGLNGAKEKNIPSWGNSDGNAYIGGVDWLNKYAEANAKVSTPIGNTSNIPRIKLRPDISVSPFYWSGLDHKGEYVIELTYDYPQMKWFTLNYLNQAMEPVYEVKVDNVAIAKVWKNDEEHVKEEFTKVKIITGKVNSDTEKREVTITLPEIEKIMKVSLNQPIKNCTQIKTGFVTTSVDNKNFMREEEDVAVDQLNRDEIKKFTPNYEFYFVARPAKTIVFNVDSPNSCLLKAKDAKITVLNP